MNFMFNLAGHSAQCTVHGARCTVRFTFQVSSAVWPFGLLAFSFGGILVLDVVLLAQLCPSLALVSFPLELFHFLLYLFLFFVCGIYSLMIWKGDKKKAELLRRERKKRITQSLRSVAKNFALVWWKFGWMRKGCQFVKGKV